MKLTQKLLGHLNRVFDKDPGRFVALRLRYDGGMSWSVADGVLKIQALGGLSAGEHTWDLEALTLRQLAYQVAALDGFTVNHLDDERDGLSALVLLDGAGDQSESNGDALFGYTSLLWALFEAWARQLQALGDQARQAVLQLSTKTGSGFWLDEIASYYGIVRMSGEADAQFGPRIIAEAVRPLANNIALERAIGDYTGQVVEVVDVTIYRGVYPIYDGDITHDGSFDYDTVGLPNYGLFDVTVAYDLLAGGDIETFLSTVQAIVGRLRAAGTHMRSLALSSAGTPIRDTFSADPTDATSGLSAAVALADSASAPSELVAAIRVYLAGASDAFTPPTDTASGDVFREIRDASGQAITDGDGAPILAIAEPLFI